MKTEVLKTAGGAAFSVDVEDWFHLLEVENAPAAADWDDLPSRVERGFMRLLDLFSQKGVSVTCFFLGWVAERHPHLVREAWARGHEIGSHGHRHRLVCSMGADLFHDDALRSRHVLEDLIGEPVRWHRAAGFSVTENAPWFFEELARTGYTHDSSVFPAAHGHGGLPGAPVAPHRIATPAGKIIEFPVSVVSVLGRPLCFFGGGYLRVSPYLLVRSMARRVIAEGRPVAFYLHPREVDPGHPRLPLSAKRRFKSYTCIDGTYLKVSRLLDDFPVTTFGACLAGTSAGGAARANA
ncbi:MAG: polysaccharide deacetylase family protein [Gemmatimonadetes bacterium]|nr:polysaccharide deacetylase family protein [Gemmatimonadota bacterium]